MEYNGGNKYNGVDWDYYNKFEKIEDKYLPMRGEGENMATQITTAISKLVYKWYNDGDVYDNTHGMRGWCNNLSSYANWLDKYTGVSFILERIFDCHTDAEYEHILKDMTDLLQDKEYLSLMEKHPKIGSVYKCDGRFKFVEDYEDEEEDYYYDEEEEE